MDDTTTYYKDPPKLICELMEDTFGDKFRGYYLGSPLRLPETGYPCIVVQAISANNSISRAATGQDFVTEQINIHFLYNADTDAQARDTQDTTVRRLYQQVQGRDPDTGFYMTGSAMHALRSNLDLGGTVINHDIDINYDVTREPGLPTIVEGIITLVTEERVAVPDRIAQA
jgi:hypothetical protein